MRIGWEAVFGRAREAAHSDRQVKLLQELPQLQPSMQSFAENCSSRRAAQAGTKSSTSPRQNRSSLCRSLGRRPEKGQTNTRKMLPGALFGQVSLDDRPKCGHVCPKFAQARTKLTVYGQVRPACCQVGPELANSWKMSAAEVPKIPETCSGEHCSRSLDRARGARRGTSAATSTFE